MRKLILSTLSIALVAFLFTAPAPAQAQEAPAVAQVFVVDVAPADLPAFLDRVSRAAAINERLGLDARTEVYVAAIAGTESNQVSVVIHHANAQAWAANGAAIAADEEWQALIAEFQAAGNVPISVSLHNRIQ